MIIVPLTYSAYVDEIFYGLLWKAVLGRHNEEITGLGSGHQPRTDVRLEDAWVDMALYISAEMAFVPVGLEHPSSSWRISVTNLAARPPNVGMVFSGSPKSFTRQMSTESLSVNCRDESHGSLPLEHGITEGRQVG